MTDVTVAYEDGTPLDGLWSEDAQAWTIAGSTTNTRRCTLQGGAHGGAPGAQGGGRRRDARAPRRRAWPREADDGRDATITVKVAEGNAEDVAMHFICVMCDMTCGTTATDRAAAAAARAAAAAAARGVKLTVAGARARTPRVGAALGQGPLPAPRSTRRSIDQGLDQPRAHGSLSIIAAECKGGRSSASGAEVAASTSPPPRGALAR